jgi:molecular chaperone DnaK
LAEASGGLAQRLYAEQAEKEGAEASGDAPADDVVDAECEEVDDDESKKD